MSTLSRRSFVGLLGAGAFSAAVGWKPGRILPEFRIRTITAGVEIASATNFGALGAAREFLALARSRFAESYEVQTTRIATQPLPRYLPSWMSTQGLEAVQELDRLASDAGVVLSVGPVLTEDGDVPGFASWATDLVQSTAATSFSSFVATPSTGCTIRPSAPQRKPSRPSPTARPAARATSGTAQRPSARPVRPSSRRRTTQAPARSASAWSRRDSCWRRWRGQLLRLKLSDPCGRG